MTRRRCEEDRETGRDLPGDSPAFIAGKMRGAGLGILVCGFERELMYLTVHSTPCIRWAADHVDEAEMKRRSARLRRDDNVRLGV
ncbi:MAG: hypothetical protein ACLTSG_12120 [Lachnospiraceae bacterium]